MKLDNKLARHLVLHNALLAMKPTGPCNSSVLMGIISELGYVQQDPLNIVARAHDHILWSRNNQYRPHMLDRLMSTERLVFEHFSHDACVLPMETLPYWTHQFERMAKKMSGPGWKKGRLNATDQAALLSRLADEGPLRSNDFSSLNQKKPIETWGKPAHKRTLDYLWLTGELAVPKRVKFFKYYDLAERIYPAKLLGKTITHAQRIDWLATSALQRLGFASVGDIKRFWEAADLADIKLWAETHENRLMNVEVQDVKGVYKKAMVERTLLEKLSDVTPPVKRIRIINPFDPLIRDRNRLAWLFGFDYRIEIYTPAVKRKFGYYVYPLLEYDTFVGRIEVRHDRELNRLCIDNLWPEPGVRFGKGRMEMLNAELQRLCRFCGADEVAWLLSKSKHRRLKEETGSLLPN